MMDSYTDYIQKADSIGMKNERTLHAQIKQWCFQNGDKVEVPVAGYIVDIVRGDLLIEIQTRNLGSMKRKLKKLLQDYKVRVIHPIAAEKQITYVDPGSGEKLQAATRKSPKKGTILDVFSELVNITDVLVQPNFELEILLISEEEVRCRDGRGSWRRSGTSIVDRKLKSVQASCLFPNKQAYLAILPPDLPEFFTTKTLSQFLGTTVNTSQKIAYCLKKLNLIEQTGKEGHSFVYSRC